MLDADSRIDPGKPAEAQPTPDLEGISMTTPSEMLSHRIPDSEFGQLFAGYAKSAWRLELLPQYLVEFERAPFQAFLNGEPVPPHPTGEWWKVHEDWMGTIREAVAQGKSIGRVHVIPSELTPYLRYEIEWGYVFNASAGDDIRFIDRANVTPEMARVFVNDFWIFDDTKVVLCDYDADGRWIGGRVLDDPSQLPVFLRAKELAIASSFSLKEFLAGYRTGKWK